MEGPRPDLLEAYGTDEVYFQSLEKRAADTIFGNHTALLSRGEWGRLRVSSNPVRQGQVDRFRAEADRMNLKFRMLESHVMSNTRENLGGPGTFRDRINRALMVQPYRIHPLAYENGIPRPPGVGSFARDNMPAEDLPAIDALTQEMTVTSAIRMGKKLAHIEKVANRELDGMGGPPPYADALMPLPPEESTAPMLLQENPGYFRQAAKHFGKGAVLTGKGLADASGRGAVAAGGLFDRMGRGLVDFAASDVKPTPKWGTGVAPAADVNQYGVPLYA